MQGPKPFWITDTHLRAKCFAIGYLNLIASIIDIVLHYVIVFIISDGFQCERTKDSLRAVQWDFVEPLLLIINLGSHGFFSYPLIFHYSQYQKNTLDYLPIPESQPSCFPGMVHVDINHVMYFLINFIWLKFVLNYVIALHKKNPKPMSLFFSVTVIKLTIQVLNLLNQLDYLNQLISYTFRLSDICLIILSLIIMHKYITEVRKGKLRKKMWDKPPAYIECLINNHPLTRVDQKMDAVFTIEENKITEEKKTTEEKETTEEQKTIPPEEKKEIC